MRLCEPSRSEGAEGADTVMPPSRRAWFLPKSKGIVLCLRHVRGNDHGINRAQDGAEGHTDIRSVRSKGTKEDTEKPETGAGHGAPDGH